MLKVCLAVMASAIVLIGPSNAVQSLDAPDRPTFDDRLPRKKEKRSIEQTFEKSFTIEREKSNLVLCSEGASSGDALEGALEACNAAVAEEPESGDACYYRGFVLFHLEKFSAAEADFTSAIKFESNHAAESYYQRGVCKERQRRLREASADFKQAAELKPEWSAARRKVEEYQWAYE